MAHKSKNNGQTPNITEEEWREFDQEFVADTFRPLSKANRLRWERMQLAGTEQVPINARLLKRVARGEVIEITRRGVPVARLVPASPATKEDPRKIAERIRELRKGCRLKGVTVRELIAEGRRF